MGKGIVTGDDSEFDRMIGEFAPRVRELALASRALINDVMPRVVEVVWPDQKSAGYGTGPRKMSEQFCWIMPYDEHVVLGFYYGSELPDPERLLEGTGKLMRHVKIRKSEDLENPALRTLIKRATKHRVPPLPRVS